MYHLTFWVHLDYYNCYILLYFSSRANSKNKLDADSVNLILVRSSSLTNPKSQHSQKTVLTTKKKNQIIAVSVFEFS